MVYKLVRFYTRVQKNNSDRRRKTVDQFKYFHATNCRSDYFNHRYTLYPSERAASGKTITTRPAPIRATPFQCVCECQVHNHLLPSRRVQDNWSQNRGQVIAVDIHLQLDGRGERRKR
ncbi:hypothetical protein CEXT_465841 [Caerostris extrusa]|uniref:Uncharacterized protein n=1 Tax=Caerostris extrusa TaxID=172846 RepID=A0AAV4PV85_CAEEX|nr:hypothetical protein CEXT_465841 [Caerostris extrusa]